MTILIVDDDPVQCRLLEAMLHKFEFETLTRDCGDAALSLLCGPDGARKRDTKFGLEREGGLDRSARLA